MSFHAFASSFQTRSRRTPPFNPGAIIGDVVQNLPGVIGDIVDIFTGEPSRPGMPSAGSTPGQVFGNGDNGAVFKASVDCVAPGFTGGVPCCPSGMHFSESTQCCVKNRRMNFQNGRAFNRAVRRIRGKARGDKRARQGITSAAKEMGCFPRQRSRSKPCK